MLKLKSLLMLAIAFGCVACSGPDGDTAEEGDAPEWIKEFEVTDKILLADFDRANLAGFDEPKFVVDRPNGEISIWQYQRPYLKTGRAYLLPGDRLRLYQEIPREAYSHRGGERDFSLHRQVNIQSNLFTDRLPFAPRFVRSHLKIKGCESFSGYKQPGEGDVAAIVTFSPEQFEEALTTLNTQADKTSEGRQNVSVFRSEFTGSRLLLQILRHASWEVDPENVTYFKFSWSDNTGDIVMDRGSLRAAFHEDWY